MTRSLFAAIWMIFVLTGCVPEKIKVESDLPEASRGFDPLRYDRMLEQERTIVALEKKLEEQRDEIEWLRQGELARDKSIFTEKRTKSIPLKGEDRGRGFNFRIPRGERITEVRVCSGRWITGLRLTYSDDTSQQWGAENDENVDVLRLGRGEYLANLKIREGDFIDWIEARVDGGDKPRTERLGSDDPDTGYRTLDFKIKAAYKVVGLNLMGHKGTYFELEGLGAIVQPIH